MERITRWRAGVLLTFFCLVLGFFGFRLYAAQVRDSVGGRDNTSTYSTMTRVKAARGDLLDRNGNVLVGNRAGYDLVMNKYVILSADDTNGELRRLIQQCEEQDIDYIEHFPVSETQPYTYTLEDYDTTWQGYFRSYLTYVGDLDSDIAAPLLMERLRDIYDLPADWSDSDVRKVIGLRFELALRSELTSLGNYVLVEDASDEELSAILELNIPGLTVEPTTAREYTTSYAAHILGYLGAMSPEQWETYEPLGYEMDAQVGQDGLEKAYEQQLHGTDGWRVDEVTKDGTVVSSYYYVEPKSGNNVETTIDLNLQIVLEDGLSKFIRDLRSNPNPKADGVDAQAAAGVVMSVKTGEILACASYPTYDPRTMDDNIDDILNSEERPMFNRALQAIYPPGSTYKMVMAIAGVESGKYSRFTKIEDMGIFDDYDGFVAYCLAYSADGVTHGAIDMCQALQYSCNYYFYVMGDNLSIQLSDDVAKQMGLGESTGVELYEETGHRANPDTKWDLYMGSDAEWYQADKILAAIGQSEHRYTPLQLCVYACTLANRGVRYKATFLKRVVSADYQNLLEENVPVVMSQTTIPEEAYVAYSTGMKMVVEPGGTGYRTLGDYPIPIAAKTGTAETDKTDASDNGALILYAPADDPEIAIALYGEQVGHGGSMGEVARAILDTYFADAVTGGEVVARENQLG